MREGGGDDMLQMEEASEIMFCCESMQVNLVCCSFADCIRGGAKSLQPQTQEVTADIRPLHGPCAHGLLQSHSRSQLQVRQQRGRGGGWAGRGEGSMMMTLNQLLLHEEVIEMRK